MNYSRNSPFESSSPRLGEILVDAGALHKRDLDQALDLQSSRDARLGDILIAHRFSSPSAVADALEAQIRHEQLDISISRPDPQVLKGVDPQICIRLKAIPWRKVGKTLLIAAADHSRFEEIAAVWPGRIRLIHADTKDIFRSIEAEFFALLAHRAATRCPDQFSCRRLNLVPQRALSGILIGVALGLAGANLDISFLVLFIWALISNFATTALRFMALFSFFFRRNKPSITNSVSRISDHRKRPKVSILIPLFKEEKIIPDLLIALNKLLYPKELLDVKILLEADDSETLQALRKFALPHWAHVLIVPADTLQTKPRAMNYSLPFCAGSIVGIYDAEDRPDPDQINKVVEHLLAAPPKVAAVQANLDFYDTEANWLSRCFTIEYAAWFRVIMRGMQKLGLPLPLGGTSVFMRRNVLEEIGGWDAHNVTEDADLGMRLARFGYKCEMVDSTTWEEANKVPVGWVKQRSRWIKGFIITWISQMRGPVTLGKDLGLAGFIGLQIVLFGTATAFLLAPVFWFMWLGIFGVEWSFFALMPAWFWNMAFIGLLVGEIIMISISVVALALKQKFGLIPFILTMPLYWPLGTIAAYKALYEIVFAPFYWDKTKHGLD